MPMGRFAVQKRPLVFSGDDGVQATRIADGYTLTESAGGSGEIGRRTRLRIWRPQGVGVQVPPSAPQTACANNTVKH